MKKHRKKLIFMLKFLFKQKKLKLFRDLIQKNKNYTRKYRNWKQ